MEQTDARAKSRNPYLSHTSEVAVSSVLASACRVHVVAEEDSEIGRDTSLASASVFCSNRFCKHGSHLYLL